MDPWFDSLRETPGIDPTYFDCDRCGEDTCVESWGDDGTRYLSCGECGSVYDVQPPVDLETP